MKTIKKTISTFLACAMLCSVGAAVMTSCTVKISTGKSNTESNVESNVSDVSGVSSDVSSESSQSKKFTKEDLGFKGLTFGMSMDEVRDKLGEPDEIEEEEVLDSIDWIYGKGYDYALSFRKTGNSEEDVLCSIFIFTDSVELENGLHVGSSFDDVIETFYQDGQSREVEFDSEDNTTGYYLYGDKDDEVSNPIQFAYVSTEEYEIDGEQYHDGSIEYYYADVTAENVENVSGDAYALIFGLSADGKEVTSIYMAYERVVE